MNGCPKFEHELVLLLRMPPVFTTSCERTRGAYLLASHAHASVWFFDFQVSHVRNREEREREERKNYTCVMKRDERKNMADIFTLGHIHTHVLYEANGDENPSTTAMRMSISRQVE